MDNDGVLYFWQKLKALLGGKVDKVSGKGLSTNDLTGALKANYDAAYTHSQTAHAPSGAEKNTIVAIKRNGTALTVESDRSVNITVPTGALASKSAVGEGDLDAALKAKVNTASSATHSHENKTVLDAIAQADLDKLDGIEAGANKYVHPSYTAKAAGLYKVTVDGTGHVSAAAAVAKADITALGIPAQDTTYTGATASKAGLMAAADKAKLDAVPTPSTLATQSYVTSQVASAGHLRREVVASLPAAASASPDVIYMVAEGSGEAGNLYGEYMLIEGAFERIGDTKTTVTAITNAEIDAIMAK